MMRGGCHDDRLSTDWRSCAETESNSSEICFVVSIKSSRVSLDAFQSYLGRFESTCTQAQMPVCWPAARGGRGGSESPPCSDIQESAAHWMEEKGVPDGLGMRGHS